MQQDLHSSAASSGPTSNGRARQACRVAAASLGVAVVAALIWFTHSGTPGEPVLFGGVLGFERTQARQTIAALGYREVTGLERHDDGSWRARAQKHGARWQVRISPYGIVSAHPSPQLGIVLE